MGAVQWPGFLAFGHLFSPVRTVYNGRIMMQRFISIAIAVALMAPLGRPRTRDEGQGTRTFSFVAEALAPRSIAPRYLGIISLRPKSKVAEDFNDKWKEFVDLSQVTPRPKEREKVWRTIVGIVKIAAADEFKTTFPFALFIEDIWDKTTPHHSEKLPSENVEDTAAELRFRLGDLLQDHAQEFVKLFDKSVFWDGEWRGKPEELRIAHQILQGRALEWMNSVVMRFSLYWVKSNTNLHHEHTSAELLNFLRHEMGESNGKALKVIKRNMNIKYFNAVPRKNNGKPTGSGERNAGEVSA
jgi:hypothetical protein